jgi:hypothetical protein
MRQLGLVGEIRFPSAQAAEGSLVFQVSRPGYIVDVKADLKTGQATLHRNELNAWGIMHLLHTFIGVRTTDPTDERDGC